MRVKIELPPPWVLAMFPQFNDYTSVVVKTSDKVSMEVKLLIVSYDLAVWNPRFCQAPSGAKFRMVMRDELHYIKSPDSRRAQAMLPLFQQTKRCVLLNGTPALSNAA